MTSIMTVSDSVPKKKLKIKFASRNIEAVPRSEACEVSQQLWMNDECVHDISLNGSKEPVMTKSHKGVPHSADNPKLCAADSLKVRSDMQLSRKRGPPGMICFDKEKRQKMDRRVKQQCGKILESLMKHPASMGFNEPVDPEKLHIPDYFTIISKPMDLGTIRTKLQDNMYFSVDEFTADVKLTFSNAMLYNPPCNHFHRAAKQLDSLFNGKLKMLETKLKRERKTVQESCISSFRERKTQETRKVCPRKSPVHGSSLPKMSMSDDERRKLRKELVEAMRGKMTKKLWTFLQQLGLISQKGEKIEIEISRFDDATLRELQRVVKDSLDARAATAEPAKIVENGRFPLGKVLQKVGGKSSCGSVKTTPSLSMVSRVSTRCRSCDSVRCQCSLQKDYVHASSMDLSSDRSSGQDCASIVEHEVKSMLTSNTSKSDPESDGADRAVHVLDEVNIFSGPQLSTIGTTATSTDGFSPAIDVQLSPKKALRAAMLKTRFADTILKAKQKTLLDHDDKVDPVKLQKEKERLERQQQEEKTRIEAQIRAAEVASALRAQEELKMQRDREREAARIALQKMEKTVDIYENLGILKELEMFCHCMSSDHLFDGADKSEVQLRASEGVHFGNPLERLGLFIKDDYIGDEDEEYEIISHDGEEGEILS